MNYIIRNDIFDCFKDIIHLYHESIFTVLWYLQKNVITFLLMKVDFL